MVKLDNQIPRPLGAAGASARSSADHHLPCLAMLRAFYPRLTDVERRIADYMLANPGRVLNLTITELARACTVGVGSVHRLTGKLGYQGYPEMRVALAVELLSPSDAVPETIREGDDVALVVQKVLDFGARSLRETISLLAPRELERTASALNAARRVEFYASGGISGPIARIAQHRFLILGVPATAVTDNDQQVASASLLGPGDLAVGLSNSGESGPVTRALEIARATGATTACVTSSPGSPVARAAEIHLLTASHETWVWSDTVASRISMLGVVDALYAYVALLRYRERGESERVAPPDGPRADAAPPRAGRG